MKKVIIIALIMLMNVGLISADKQVYIEIVGTQGLFNPKKVSIQVDFGQNVAYFKQNSQYLVDNNGEMIKFHSMVDGLNYLGNYNWKFIQAYTISNNKQNVYHFMLMKTIKNDSELTDGIMTKEYYNSINE